MPTTASDRRARVQVRALRPEPHAPLHEPAPLPALARLPAYPWLVVGTVCVGAFMGQLDASIAQLVLPTLEGAFHARLNLVSWVSLSYLLALAGTLPIFGRLADMVGRKLLYTYGFVVFVAGSALCGVAPSLGVLIAARVFQALGAGLLQANSVAIVTAAAGPRQRGRAIGIQGAAQAIGLSTGPALGGLLIPEPGLALGVLDQRAGWPARRGAGLAHLAAHHPSAARSAIRLVGRRPAHPGPDRPVAGRE